MLNIQDELCVEFEPFGLHSARLVLHPLELNIYRTMVNLTQNMTLVLISQPLLPSPLSFSWFYDRGGESKSRKIEYA